MGVWSPELLDGDGPMDDVSAVMAFVRVRYTGEHDWNHDAPACRAAFAKKSPRQWERFIAKRYEPDKSSQVVAFLLLELGLPVPVFLAQAAQRANRAEDLSAWFRPSDSVARRAVLDALEERLRPFLDAHALEHATDPVRAPAARHRL